MTDRLVMALAQINPTVGDVRGNTALVLNARETAARANADIVITPELAIEGYPPEDLILRQAFQDQVADAIDTIAKATDDGGPAVLLGASARQDGELFNAMFLLDHGVVKHTRLKHDLPNYGVFDEKRIFSSGPLPGPIPFGEVRIGAMICEDMWSGDVTECHEENGADVLVVINGSPFSLINGERRMNEAVARVLESRLPLVYVNRVGGQDELVFDGSSFVLDRDWQLKVSLPTWQPSVAVTHWQRTGDGWTCTDTTLTPERERQEEIYRALMTGLGDYVNKNRFPGVLIGLSGGIDSALSAAVAVDALGPERVHCVMMASEFTSQESLDDARACADALGVRLDCLPIDRAVDAFDTTLGPLFASTEADATEENIQARSRGILLMALSNKFGKMVVSTGNKSEMSVGYATVYGDMCGGYAVLKDVYKTDVYRLSQWRNLNCPDDLAGPAHPVIPVNIITKAPTAELRHGQTDQDNLPPYDVLDDILTGLVEREETFEQIASRGHDRVLVERVWHMLMQAEYKRRQAPPGVRITTRAFGRDRRYPITNGFRS